MVLLGPFFGKFVRRATISIGMRTPLLTLTSLCTDDIQECGHNNVLTPPLDIIFLGEKDDNDRS